ncbi:dynamin family protein [Candidatus Neomarinimicrobiota bacterium]
MDNYNLEIKKIADDVSLLKKVAKSLNFKNIIEKATKIEDGLNKDNFIITVVGEFNRGKSTFINALLGVDIIPTGVRPTTATINIIHYDEKPGIKVHKKNGEINDLSFSKDILKEFTSLVEFDPASVKYIEVMYPIEYLKDGTIIVDTPGVNDMNQQRLDITYGYMPVSDSVIFLLDSNKPFAGTEKSFLEDQVLSNNISSIFFIANKSDKLNEDEINESIDAINNNLKGIVKAGKPLVFALSSLDALKAKLNGDQHSKSTASFTNFENTLKEFIRSNQQTKIKLKKYKNQIIDLCALLIENINIEKSNNARSSEEILAMSQNIDKSEKMHAEVFKDLLKYVDEQTESLKTRIDISLLKDHNSIKESLLYEVDLVKGDLTDYAEKVIPFKIKQSNKHWIEQSQPFIEQNVLTIFNKAIEGFKKHFSKTPIIRQLATASELSTVSDIDPVVVNAKDNLSNINKGSFALGSLIFGGVAIATGGLSLAVLVPTIMGGKISQALVGGHFSKKKFEEQKLQIKNNLPNVLIKTYETLRQNTDKLIDKKINFFKDSLSLEFQQTFIEIKQTLQQKLETNNAVKESLEDRQKYLTGSISKIENILGSY